MVALSKIWYEEHEKTSFHFFNDNAEWNQMDKLGHIFTAFHLSSISKEGLQWAGVKKKDAVLYGAAAGLLMIMPVELLDGYSKSYGASPGDMVSNLAGTGLFVAQHSLWGEARITPKLSFHQTDFAPLRPEVLGDGLSEEWLKDYNGQTYWFSFDLDKFIDIKKPWFNFINLAIGHGSNGMVYARDEQNNAAGYEAYRQYYLAIDIDLTAIKTQNKWLKRILFIANTVRLPAPALSFDAKQKLKFHPFYF